MNALTDQKTFGSNDVVLLPSSSPLSFVLFKTIATVSLRNDIVMLDVSVLELVENRSRGVDDDDDESNSLES